MALSNDRVVDEFARRSPALDWRRPVFGYLNLQAAHFPYGHAGMPLSVIKNPIDRRALHSSNPDLVRLAYLNAVAYTDASVARLVQHLKTRGQWDRTLLVVCGDHGEALFENGVLGHGVRADRLQNNALLVTNRRVPALDRVVGQRDLPPLLLQALGAQLSGPWEPEGERAFVYVSSARWRVRTSWPSSTWTAATKCSTWSTPATNRGAAPMRRRSRPWAPDRRNIGK